MTSTVLSPPTTDFPKSKIRRKPIATYKSPAANDVDPLLTLSTSSDVPSTSTQSLRQCDPPQNVRATVPSPQKKSYSLPLYHPLGELALSLPPLNPTEFGLPLPHLPDGTSKRSSASSQRASSKPPDDEEDVFIPTVSSIAAVAANEVKRASPRKRRGGMAGGKRKRRDVEDGDATYPAKRTRQIRGGGEDDNDFDDAPGQGDDDGLPDVDAPAERRGRRSTRSRTKRRDSSDIESSNEHPAPDSLTPPEENAKPQPTQGIPDGTNEGIKGK